MPRTVGYLIDDLDVPDADLPDSLYHLTRVLLRLLRIDGALFSAAAPKRARFIEIVAEYEGSIH